MISPYIILLTAARWCVTEGVFVDQGLFGEPRHIRGRRDMDYDETYPISRFDVPEQLRTAVEAICECPLYDNHQELGPWRPPARDAVRMSLQTLGPVVEELGRSMAAHLEQEPLILRLLRKDPQWPTPPTL